MGRLKHIHLVLMLGLSLFIPLLLAYCLYYDLSGTVLLSSDMSFEDPDDEDLSDCQNDLKLFVPAIPSIALSFWAHFGGAGSLFRSPLASHSQTKPVLRC